jgi:hypothetical protein
LRARFYALVGGGPEIESVPEVKPVNPQPAEAVPQQSRLDWSGGSDPATPTEAVSAQSPLELLAEAIAAMAPENAGTEVARPIAGADAAALNRTQGNVAAKRRESEARSIIRENPAEPLVPPASIAEPAFARMKEKRPKRGLSVHFSEGLRQLVPHIRTAEPGRFTLLKRIVWVALVIAFICLILWALAPRGFLFGQETPAEWDFQQPTPALASHAAPAAPSGPAADLPQPGNTSGLPDTTGTATPNIPAAPLAKHHGTVRTPLVHPIPSNATAGVPPRAKRHRRHLLGLGKLWHWVRHPHHTRNDQAAQ